jgi:hypothetical protein
VTQRYVRLLLLFFSFGVLAAQRQPGGRLSVTTTVQGSFSLAVTSDSGGTVNAAGTKSATLTIPISGATHFVFHASSANMVSNRYILYARIQSAASGWAIDGVDLIGNQERTVSTEERFDTDAVHTLVNAQPATASSITFRVVPN